MNKLNISKDANGDFKVIGIGHNGNGSDALYSTFSTLDAALNDVIQWFRPAALNEIYAQRIAEDNYILAVVTEDYAERRLIDLFKLGGRSRAGEIAKHCGIQYDVFPQEFAEMIPTTKLAFLDTVYAKALFELSRLNVVKLELEKDGPNEITWYMARQYPIEPPNETIALHTKPSTKFLVMTDVTDTYIRFHAYGFCAEQNMNAFWFGTFNSLSSVFKRWHESVTEDTSLAIGNAYLFTDHLKIEQSRMPLVLELENGLDAPKVRMTISGITKDAAGRIIENFVDDTIHVSQILEDGLTLDMEVPNVVFSNLTYMPLEHKAVAETLVNGILNEIKLGIEITPATPIKYETPKRKEPMEFIDYFDQRISYPQDVVSNPLPINTLWEYISSSFLNGFINYVTPLCVHVVDRYATQDQVLTEDEDGPFPKYRNRKGDWIAPVGPITKRDLIKTYVDQSIGSIDNLQSFADDVLILGRCGKEHPNLYMYFWFDHDVSDCCIGRFLADDSEETVIERFRAFSKERSEKLTKGISTEIPLTLFKNSWLSF